MTFIVYQWIFTRKWHLFKVRAKGQKHQTFTIFQVLKILITQVIITSFGHSV